MLPRAGERSNPESMHRMSQRAEALGFGSCWLSDHTTDAMTPVRRKLDIELGCYAPR